VVNARDAMPEGGKLVIETTNAEIESESAEARQGIVPGAYVKLAVSDTGVGMDRQTLIHIFEPFFTTKEIGKGTGLGLSTVYGIVKQSGGGIVVRSEPGAGAVFEVYLPRDATAVDAGAPQPQPRPGRTTGNETVLLVEDEDALRGAVKRSLASEGYTVLAADGGESALRLAAEHGGDIHLLLADVVMPRMGGKALASELTRQRPGIKVLYMSGYLDQTLLPHGALDPAAPLLGKPFSASDLIHKVREVLDEGMRGAVAECTSAPLAASPAAAPLQLTELPRATVFRLLHAVSAAHHDELVELLESIRAAHPQVAARLSSLVERFDYEGIRALLRG
jgi:two-component system cell cycle sensor histidine kinase/response regulator CckA